jgi:hypothetical protein
LVEEVVVAPTVRLAEPVLTPQTGHLVVHLDGLAFERRL